jgi:hypothetical protein
MIEDVGLDSKDTRASSAAPTLCTPRPIYRLTATPLKALGDGNGD